MRGKRAVEGIELHLRGRIDGAGQREILAAGRRAHFHAGRIEARRVAGHQCGDGLGKSIGRQAHDLDRKLTGELEQAIAHRCLLKPQFDGVDGAGENTPGGKKASSFEGIRFERGKTDKRETFRYSIPKTKSAEESAACTAAAS